MNKQKFNVFFLTILMALAFTIMTGCSYPHKQALTSQTPIPNFHNLSTQQVCASVQHWETLANQVGDELQTRMQRSAMLYDKNVFVTISGPTDFSKAFHNYLVTSLIDRNINVTNIQGDNIILEYDIQIVNYDNFDRRELFYINKDLAPNFQIPYNMKLYGENTNQKEARKMIRNAYLAGLENLHPFNELIVTCSLIYRDKYIGRFNKSFYIENIDDRLYRNTKTNFDSRLKTYTVTN